MAASATAGILVGVSRSAGDAWFALAAGGHLWMGFGERPPWLFLAVGALRHLVIFGALGALWGRLAGRRVLAMQVLCAALLALAAVGLSPWLPDLLRPVAIDLRPVEAAACVVTAAAALVAGGRMGSS